MPILRVFLTDVELQALDELARRERRPLAAQGAVMITALLRAQGLLLEPETETAEPFDMPVTAGSGLQP